MSVFPKLRFRTKQNARTQRARDIALGIASGMEYLVRGLGFIGAGKTKTETIEQIEDTVVITRDGVPITVGELAKVQTGPAFRRGALDFNGSEAVGGVVVMRYGENPRKVIDRVKAKIASLGIRRQSLLICEVL